MAEVSNWTMFAYFSDDETGESDEHRAVAEWQIENVVAWARHRGYDTILLSRDPASTTRFRKPPRVSRVRPG